MKFSCWCGAAALLAFTACSNRPPAGKANDTGAEDVAAARVPKLGFVTNGAAEFWKSAAAGVHEYEAPAKVQLDRVAGL